MSFTIPTLRRKALQAFTRLHEAHSSSDFSIPTPVCIRRESHSKITMSEANTTTMPTAAEILDRFCAAERVYMAAAPADRDFSGMASTLSPTMMLYQSPDLPYGGEYEGHEGFRRWGEAMAERFDVVDVMEPRVLEKGDDVVVLSTLLLRVRKTGKELVNPFCQVVQVDREKDIITEIRPFYWNVRGLNEALAE